MQATEVPEETSPSSVRRSGVRGAGQSADSCVREVGARGTAQGPHTCTARARALSPHMQVTTQCQLDRGSQHTHVGSPPVTPQSSQEQPASSGQGDGLQPSSADFHRL